MDGDWDEVARIAHPPPGPMGNPTPPTVLAFDTNQELLWTGNGFGRVMSFYGNKLQPYTSFRIHPSQDGAVRQILFNDKGVVSLGPRGVHMANRRGLPLWSIRHEDFTALRCMSFTSRGTTEILVAGEQYKMFVIDTNKGEVTKQVSTGHQYSSMRRSRYICAATPTGAVHILDPITFQVLKIWQPHTSALNDMDAQHDFIVTCGYSLRQQGHYIPDPFVNVFDLKNMVSMSPIPFPAGASYVRMHPRMSTTTIVVTQLGQMQVVDLMNPNTSNIHQANCQSYVSMIEIASSGEAVAMADVECNIHLLGSPNKLHFTDLATPIEYADATASAARIGIDSLDTPLSSIGMPFYRETLLSAWPENMVTSVGAPPVKIDPQVLSTLQEREWGYWGKNIRPQLRNQVEDTRSSESPKSRLRPPRFLSEKARDLANSPAGTPAPEETIPEFPQVSHDANLECRKAEVPELYRTIEIKYSRFGIGDFDFGYFNKTQYSGLQNHIVNAYANSLLQVMHYTPLIRNIALQHAATACVDELCLLCESGFLFDMLHKAEGEPCQAYNLTKTLSYHPQASQAGLLDSAPLVLHSRTTMLQHLAKFLLERMSVNYNKMARNDESSDAEAPQSKTFEELFRMSAVNSIRCMNCRIETTRSEASMVTDMIYPLNNPEPRNPRPRSSTFSQIIKISLERETTNKGWCSNCLKYQALASRKTVQRIPDVLMLTTAINSAINGNAHRRLWATPGWLPEEIGIIAGNGQFFCYEGEDLKLHLQRGRHNIKVYSLTGLVVNIEGGLQHESHLVAMANVAHSAPVAPGQSQWYMFNDFHVQPISSQEALTFNTTWKTPSVLTYQVKTANNQLDSSWKKNLDDRLLYLDLQPDRADKPYRTLEPSEPAGPDTLIAIDTEFVQISQSEMEVHSDGDAQIIRPIFHALARVSIVRGGGMDEGIPFIDDYITIKEKVHNYLTSYSGITEEDLDVTNPRGHNLVPLKIAYKKIWILLNLGCKFLGHGLSGDFRVINIHVPKSQVIDTSTLFFIKERLRKLSLQFLAYAVLREEIQKDTHDSIEDARTALRLYRKYQEYSEAGILETILREIYVTGSACNFKAPRRTGADVPRTDTPPVDGAPGHGPSTPVRRPGGTATPGSTPLKGLNFG
ncbi:Uu.00g125670.m01.CDS01 [Anthostomella pinea]|uniref:PAN2-PAN3 deadenylation complex catalytic subunit PAN2 n=1 Tax=Anthostomella pinea TaxID=933095 RepID=A0AAI8YFA9_9PEZI|nr:Uu.00g125670.m01.CDS01 [Anthostomella pinea]